MSLQEEGRWVTVARLGRAWGNRGELAAVSLTSKPERFQRLGEVFLFRDGSARAVRSRWRRCGNTRGEWIFKFRGVDTISEAEQLERRRGAHPDGERVALEEGEYFQSDLIGCEVRDRATGELVGVVTGWEDAGSAGLLEVGERLLIPFARSICVEIDSRGETDCW